MRIALVSDVHSNLHALRAVLDDMQERGVDRMYSLGDVVGYNAFPSECTALVRERADASILGNHDWAATIGNSDGFNPVAKAAIEFTRRELQDEDVKYLSSLEPHTRILLPSLAIDLYHGSPTDPLREYVFPPSAHGTFDRLVEELPADRPHIVVLGHTHVPMALASHALAKEGLGDLAPFLAEDRLESDRATPLVLVNPGSVGQPRDGDPRAAYAILDSDDASVVFVRVDYDVGAAARAIRDAGLPDILASRLSLGR